MTGYCTKCDYSTLEHDNIDKVVEEVIRAGGEGKAVYKGFKLKCPICGQTIKIK